MILIWICTCARRDPSLLPPATHLLGLVIRAGCGPPTAAETWHLKSTQMQHKHNFSGCMRPASVGLQSGECVASLLSVSVFWKRWWEKQLLVSEKLCPSLEEILKLSSPFISHLFNAQVTVHNKKGFPSPRGAKEFQITLACCNPSAKLTLSGLDKRPYAHISR